MSLITPARYEEAMRDFLGDRFHKHPTWPDHTSNGPFDAHGITHHWTGMSALVYSAAAQNEVLVWGHSIPGPLAHEGIHRNGHVTATGWHNCNHAGLGDYDIYRRVLAGTYDGHPLGTAENFNGNGVFYGEEYHYHPDDGPMPDEQVEAGILAAAAKAQAHGWDPDTAAGSNLDHYEWASRRKWDRQLQNLADRTRAGVRQALIDGPGGAMPSPQEVAHAVWAYMMPTLDADPDPQAERSAQFMLALTKQNATLARWSNTSPDAIAEAVVARLPEGVDFTAADVARELIAELGG